jgi:hypothetical protein
LVDNSVENLGQSNWAPASRRIYLPAVATCKAARRMKAERRLVFVCPRVQDHPVIYPEGLKQVAGRPIAVTERSGPVSSGSRIHEVVWSQRVLFVGNHSRRPRATGIGKKGGGIVLVGFKSFASLASRQSHGQKRTHDSAGIRTRVRRSMLMASAYDTPTLLNRALKRRSWTTWLLWRPRMCKATV